MKLFFYILLLIISSNYMNLKSAAQITDDLDRTPLIRTSSGATYIPGYHQGAPRLFGDAIEFNPNIIPFKIAIRENDIKKAAELIELDKKNIDPSKFATLLVNTNMGSFPVLNLAISEDNVPLVQLLLDNGADINSYSYDALKNAQDNGNDEIIKLIETKKESNSKPEASVRNKSLELLGAVKKNDISRAEMLIANGADVNYKIDESTARPIIDLAKTPQMLKLLIDHNANVNHIWEQKNGVTRTALVSMINQNIFETPYIPENIKILLAHGADINFRNSFGQTPLDIARELRAEYEQMPVPIKNRKKYLDNIQPIIDILKAEPKRRLDEQKKIYEQELQVTNLPKVLSDIVSDYAEEPINYSEVVKQKRILAQKKRKEKINKALASTFPPGVTNIISGYLDESYAEIPETEKID